MKEIIIGDVNSFNKGDAAEHAITSWNLSKSSIKVLEQSINVNSIYLACTVNGISPELIFPVILILSKKQGSWYFREVKEYDKESLKYCYASQKLISLLSESSRLYDLNKSNEALKWREKCSESVLMIKENTLKVGDVIEFENEISFSNGLKGKIFKKTKGSARFTRLKRTNGKLVEMKHITFSINNYRKLNFEHITT